MAYLVSAKTGASGGLSVVAQDALRAVAVVEEYVHDGFTEIVILDLDGHLVQMDELQAKAAGLVN